MASIVFSIDNQVKSFNPGDKVTGLLTLTLDSRASIKGITLNCVGKWKVAWNILSQVHFKEKINLLETGDTTFERGSCVFPFSFQLPSVGLPCTFRSAYCTIKYYLHAIVKTQIFKQNAEEKCHFEVIGGLDLNSKGPVLQKPTEIRQMKCISCARGSVAYSLIAEKTAFVPGEFLCFQVDILNDTNKPIDFLAVNILQAIVITGRAFKKQIFNTFTEVRGPVIAPLEEKSWKINESDGVVIAQLPPTRRRDIVIINYAIQIVVKMSNGEKLSAFIPILIGTIPFTTKLEGSPSSTGIRKIPNQPFYGKS